VFFLLLGFTLLTSLAVCYLTAAVFARPIAGIMTRIIADDIAHAWTKYLNFAIYVVGVSGGVRIYQLERYITPPSQKTEPLQLTAERWVLEIYRTIIESLQAIAWMLLVFFVFALIAYVVVRAKEARGSFPASSLNPGEVAQSREITGEGQPEPHPGSKGV